MLLEKLKLLASTPLEMDDFGLAMLSFYHDRSLLIADTVLSGVSGKKLTKLGLKKDVLSCSSVDLYNEVPRLQGDTLVK